MFETIEEAEISARRAIRRYKLDRIDIAQSPDGYFMDGHSDFIDGLRLIGWTVIKKILKEDIENEY